MKIAMNNAARDGLLTLQGEYPSIGRTLDRFEFRAQGTGVAWYGEVDADEARELQIHLRDLSEEAAQEPRGSGGYDRRKAYDRVANRIGAALAEQNGGGEVDVDSISPKGLPMKAKGGKLEERHAEGWTMEPKIDGWRATVHVHDDGRVSVWIGAGREDVAAKVPHLAAELAAKLPPGTILDGELCILTDGDRPDDWGGASSVLQADVGKKPQEVVERVSFVAFDMIACEGADIRSKPFERRRSLLESTLSSWAWRHVCPVAQCEPSQATLEAILAAGYEGAVVKKLSATYRTGKRVPEQVKVKPQITDDVRIVGFSEGEGDFTGYIGAIEFEGQTNDGVPLAGRCSGMDWAVRVAMSEARDEHVGRWIEIKHFGVHPSGGVKSPNFKRFRPDRDGAR